MFENLKYKFNSFKILNFLKMKKSSFLLIAAFIAFSMVYAQQTPQSLGFTAKQAEKAAALEKSKPQMNIDDQRFKNAEERELRTNSGETYRSTPILRAPDHLRMNGSENVPTLPRGERGNNAYAYMQQTASSAPMYARFNTDNFFPVTPISTSLTPYLYGGGCYNGVLYAYESVIVGQTVNDVSFYRINVTTGAVIGSAVIPDLYGNVVDAVCYNYREDKMYAIMNPDIYTVNLTTGALTYVSTISGLPGDEYDAYALCMSIDVYGTMYIITPGNSSLYTLNTQTGVATLVGSTGVTDVNFAQSMSFDNASGKLYWNEMHRVGNNPPVMNFREINIATGEATIITQGTRECTVFCIPFEYNGNKPLAVTNLTVTPDSDGSLSLTLGWINPTVNIAGQALTNITINIYENGSKITSIASSMPGGVGTYSRTVSTAANYTYKVVAETNGGEGLENSVTLFVGLDLPGAAENVVLTRDPNDFRVATLTWDAPTTGMNGGYFSTDNIRYDVYRDGNVLVGGGNMTTLSFTETFSSPPFTNHYYKIVTKNVTGTGGSVNSKLMNFKGIQKEFPWRESFTEETFVPYGWDQFRFGMLSSEKWERYTKYGELQLPLYYSAPAGAGHWCDLDQNADAWLVSPALELSSLTSSNLEFMSQIWFLGWYNNGENSIWVSKGSNDPASGDFVKIKSWSYEEAKEEYGTSTHPNWKFHKVSLEDFIGETVHIAFRYLGRDACNWFIDDIRVAKVADYDLKATLHGPISLPIGKDGDFFIQVDNIGKYPISDYTVKLSRRETHPATAPVFSVGSVTGETILPGETKFYKITWNHNEIRNFYMIAEIECDDDGDLDNNIINDYFCSTTIASESVWTYMMSFEPHEDWQSWKVVDAGRQGCPTWWCILAISEEEAGHLDYLMMYATNHADDADDWIFSPKIYFDINKAYKISFWVNTRGDEGTYESMAFYRTTGDTPQDVFGEPLWIDAKLANRNWKKIEINVAGFEGLQKFGVHCFSNAMAFYPYFDYFIVEETLTVKGTVTSGSNPVEGAMVQATGNSLKTYSDANGKYFYGLNNVGSYQFKASKVGYYDETKNVSVTSNNQVIDFDLNPRPSFTLSGKVVGNDTNGVGIAGVRVALSGYNEYEAITDANGDYSIPGVFDTFTYNVNATFAGRAPFVGEVKIEGANKTYNFTMTELLYPVAGITVSEVSVSNPNANVTWIQPNGKIDRKYTIDDNSMEDGQTFWAGNDVGVGNFFPLESTESGTMTSFELYSWANPMSGDDRMLHIRVFNANKQFIGRTAEFKFNQKTSGWITVNVPATPAFNFTGGFYVMVMWTSNYTDMANFLGLDSNGPNSKEGLDYYIYDGEFYPYTSLSPWTLSKCVFGIRVNADCNNSKVQFDLTKENEDPSRGRTGYNVYRGLKGTPVSGWTKIQSNVTTTSYSDANAWTTLNPGVYQYAATAVYTGGYESNPRFSNDMPIDMNIPFTVNISTNDGSAASGATVILRNNDGEQMYQQSIGAGATSTTFNNVWRGNYNLTVTLKGYSKHITKNVDITQTNTAPFTVNLVELLYPVEEISWKLQGPNMLINWSEPIDNLEKTYIYDDSTAEYGGDPGQEMHIGAKFPVNETGELTSVDLYSIAFIDAEPKRLSVEVFNANHELIGKSEKFLFNQTESKWVNVALDNIPYSGTFYVMVRWHDGFGYRTNYLGYDYDGDYSKANLDYVRTPEGNFEILHEYWSYDQYVRPCAVMIRANANSLGQSVRYGTEFGFKTIENPSVIVNETISSSNKATSVAFGPEIGTFESVKVEEPVSRNNSKSFTGKYNLYRLLENQPEANWITLGENITSNSYVDEATLVSGTVYKWAVKALYSGNLKSSPTFTKNYPHGMIATVKMKIVTNSGDAVNGARIILAHNNGKPENNYPWTINNSDTQRDDILKGTYRLTITLNGFDTYTATGVMINNDVVDLGTITLIETIKAPFNLEMATENSCKQVFSWNNIYYAKVTLQALEDIYEDYSGYQMWLDSKAPGLPFDENSFPINCTTVSLLFRNFDYSIPQGAYPACELAAGNPNWVYGGSKTVEIPSGVYDYIIVNYGEGQQGRGLWAAGGNNSANDSYNFEPFKHYIFDIVWNSAGNGDFVNLTVQNAKDLGSTREDFGGTRNFLGYRVYLNDVEVAITKNLEYAFEGLPAGNYKAGIQAVYTSGVSAILTVNFTSTCPNPTLPDYTITASSANTQMGKVTGGGSFKKWDTAVVEAIPEEGFELEQWLENGVWASYSARYEFKAMANRNLVAVFRIKQGGINDNELANVVLYPNPFSNEINISNSASVKSIEITNLAGQKVKSVIFNGKSISTGDLAAGIYFITIESITGNKVVHKMVKK